MGSSLRITKLSDIAGWSEDAKAALRPHLEGQEAPTKPSLRADEQLALLRQRIIAAKRCLDAGDVTRARKILDI